MGVSFPPSRNRLCFDFNDAMASFGYAELEDFNVPEPNGYGFRQGTIWKGRRVSTASAYLRPAMARSNLRVLTGTQARRVLLDGRRAVGVETQTTDGIRRFRATREVVVCAGSYQSPQLLLNSGIGDEAALHAAGVTPRHHLPAVGRHLQDHPSAPIAMDMSDATSYGLSWKALPRNIVQIFQYLLLRTGPLASNLFETNAYIKTAAERDRPDMQIVFQPARRNIKPFPIPQGHGFGIVIVNLYPKSVGAVTLAGPDPLALPNIDLGIGHEPSDLDFLVAGLRVARQIFAHASFQQYSATERMPGPDIASDEALLDYVQDTLTTVHHPASSCRMGPAGDNVVDHELRVHGLEALRVADASIFPRLVGANTNAAVVAVAEKASDLVLGRPAPPKKGSDPFFKEKGV
jgi:choline dehydrogenase-like flavoprotein